MLKLQEIREQKGILQKDLAEKLNKTRACISSWETAKTEPDIESLIQIANVLEVTVDYLIGRSDEMEVINIRSELTPDQNELLNLYNQMSFRDKNRLIGYAQGLVY